MSPDRTLPPQGQPGIGGDTVPHLATRVGARDDPAFQKAYWQAFDKTFGDQNAHMIKSMLLSKVKSADTGDSELDRVCQGLRMTMGWLAEAIERTALEEAGFDASAGPREPPKKPSGPEIHTRP
jgi:hypothetical protein